MGHLFIKEYRSYKSTGDAGPGEILAATFYSELTHWITTGSPNEQFLDEFWDLYTHIQDSQSAPSGDLIDLGIMQTAEAVHQYHQEDEKDTNPAVFYVNEARWPFFAYIDEQSYRLARTEDFSEIDFYIFEIIGGDFPHTAAKEFLIENDWADIWTALRYLDTVPGADDRYHLINELFLRRKTVHEKLILLAYLVFTENEYIEALLIEGTLKLPAEFGEDFVFYIYNLLDAALYGHPLSVDWKHRLHEKYVNYTLFFLLAYFEISQTELSPGWVSVIEQSLDTVWDYSVISDDNVTYSHQPLQDFTANLLQLFTEEDLSSLLETSLIYPVFFRNIDRYNPESLENLLGILLRNEELMLRELAARVDAYRDSDQSEIEKLIHGTCQDIAKYLGCEIRLNDGSPSLWGPEGSFI